MRFPRSYFDPLHCIRQLEAEIRYEERQSKYSTETRVLRFGYDGELIARETHGREEITNPSL